MKDRGGLLEGYVSARPDDDAAVLMEEGQGRRHDTRPWCHTWPPHTFPIWIKKPSDHDALLWPHLPRNLPI
jgi:hypothetical protein